MARRNFLVRRLREDGKWYYYAGSDGPMNQWLSDRRTAYIFKTMDSARAFAEDCPEDLNAQVIHKSEAT